LVIGVGYFWSSSGGTSALRWLQVATVKHSRWCFAICRGACARARVRVGGAHCTAKVPTPPLPPSTSTARCAPAARAPPREPGRLPRVRAGGWGGVRAGRAAD
jgi:hypothetical protein